LKVLLVNLLAALNFANVFLKIKKRLGIKKNVKNVTKIKKNVKIVFTSMVMLTSNMEYNAVNVFYSGI